MGTMKLALKLVLITMVIKDEFIDAKWSEIDFRNKTWIIPAERLKKRKAHVIYLSR